MAKRKQQPEEFDVTEFLRPTDADMKSAITALLRGTADSAAERSQDNVVIMPPGGKLPTGGLSSYPEDQPKGRDSEQRVSPPGGDLPPEGLIYPGDQERPLASAKSAIISPPGDISPPGGQIISHPPFPRTANQPAAQDAILNAPPGGKLHPGGRKQPRIYRCIRAQDGHSTAEEILYQALWREGKPESTDTRILTVGYRGMSGMTRLDPKTVKYVCQSLASKLAIEQIADENTLESIGRTYRVYSYRAILQRRSEAGLEWIRRLPGGGVSFVLESGTVSPVGKLPTGAEGSLPTGPGGHLPPAPGGDLPIPEERDRKLLEESSSSEAVAKTFRRYVPAADDEVIRELIANCRNRAPDVTGAEIGYFIGLKGDLMRKMTVKNPAGFLLHAVPKCVDRESLHRLREMEARRTEMQSRYNAAFEAEAAERFAEQRRILEDPRASDEDRRFARRILGFDEEQAAGQPPELIFTRRDG